LKVRWAARALADIAGIFAYVASDNEAAAGRGADRLMGVGYELGEHPRLGRPGRQPGTRELVIGKYVLVYRLSAEVTVLAVVQGARRK
jgi:toxin ParE1/3/4